MGTVSSGQEVDDEYSKEIIAKIRGLSPELDEYYVTESYLLEADQDVITATWLRNRLLIKVIDQLHDRGIDINLDTDKLLDSPLLIDAVLTLRSKFDADNLFELLRDHQDLREEISELLDDDCIEDVITTCNKLLPIDEGWDSLVNLLELRPEILRSSAEFTAYVQKALDRCDRLGDNDPIAETDTDKLMSYIKYLSERKTKVAKLAASMYSIDETTGQVNKNRIDHVYEVTVGYESELSRPENIRKFIDGELDVKNFVDQLRMFYTNRWRHCFDYYTAKDHQALIPSDLEMAVLIATLYIDAPDQSHARIHVIETFENLADMLGDRYMQFRTILDRLLGNLVVVEGGMNNATN